jgi:hypothetical protein
MRAGVAGEACTVPAQSSVGLARGCGLSEDERSGGAPYFVRALFERPLAQLRAERRWLTSVIEDVE